MGGQVELPGATGGGRARMVLRRAVLRGERGELGANGLPKVQEARPLRRIQDDGMETLRGSPPHRVHRWLWHRSDEAARQAPAERLSARVDQARSHPEASGWLLLSVRDRR